MGRGRGILLIWSLMCGGKSTERLSKFQFSSTIISRTFNEPSFSLSGPNRHPWIGPTPNQLSSRKLIISPFSKLQELLSLSISHPLPTFSQKLDPFLKFVAWLSWIYLDLITSWARLAELALTSNPV